MSPEDTSRQLEQIARDLDLAVFGLERALEDETALRTERARLRRELERMRDRLEGLARNLTG